MSDRLKVHSVLSGNENCPSLGPECGQDVFPAEDSNTEVTLAEGSTIHDGAANVQAIQHSHGSLEPRPIIHQPLQTHQPPLVNPAGWESSPSAFYPIPTRFPLNSHVESRSFASWPSRNIIRNVTPLRSVERPHTPVDLPLFPRSTLSSDASFHPQHPISTSALAEVILGRPSLPHGLDGTNSSVAPSLNQSAYTSTTNYSGSGATRDHDSNAQRQHSRVGSHGTVDTSDSERFEPETHTLASHMPDPVPLERGPVGGQSYLLGVSRDTNVQEWTPTQGQHATEESGHPLFGMPSDPRRRTPRSRPIAAGPQSLGPPDTGVGPQMNNDDGDDLPALLSESDGSESDRLPSPEFSAEIVMESTPTSDEGRSRFLHPGTPIQTELPEVQSFLHLFQTGERTRVWMVPDTNFRPDELEVHMARDDDDIAGDLDRAQELLDGLEYVDEELVRRYEKVRGNGDDICTVCRDLLLPPEGKYGDEAQQPLDPEAASNLVAYVNLPFQPSHTEWSIYAFPCTHLFHTGCLVPWLSLKTTCPTCRLDIDPDSLTLRVRGWDTTQWPHANDHVREYVNLDALGRRIPWRRPAAPSLDEWVTWRENESPEKREERLKRRPHRHSEPTCSSAWRGEPRHAPIRRSTLTYQDSSPRLPGLSISDVSRDPAPLRGSRGAGPAGAAPGRVAAPRGIVDADASQNAIHMPFGALPDRPPPLGRPIPFQPNTHLRRLWRPLMPAGDAAPEMTGIPSVPSVALAPSLHGQLDEPDTFTRAATSPTMSPPDVHDTSAPLADHTSPSVAYGSRQNGLNRALEISRTVGDLLERARQRSSINSSLQTDTVLGTEATLDHPPLRDRHISELGPHPDQRRSPVPSPDFLTRIQQLRDTTRELIADIRHSTQSLRGFDRRPHSGAQASPRRLLFPAIDGSPPSVDESPPLTPWTYARTLQSQDSPSRYLTSSPDRFNSGSHNALAISPASSPIPQPPQRLLDIAGIAASYGPIHSNVLHHEGPTEDHC